MNIYPFKYIVGGVLVGFLLGCAQSKQGAVRTAAQPMEQVTEAPAQAIAPPEEALEAMTVIKNMADYLAGAKKFSVRLKAGYDVVQDWGQKIEFSETREMTLVRPDLLRAESTESDGGRRLFIFDGRTISFYSSDDNVYATADRPGTVDEAIKHFIQDLHMRIPLAMMFMSTLPAELENRVLSAEYVEFCTLTDVPTHHVAAQSESVDFQVWVAAVGEPLPLRVVISYKDEPGQPQFWANFSNWNFSPVVSDNAFVFTPPGNAEKIPFLAELRKSHDSLK